VFLVSVVSHRFLAHVDLLGVTYSSPSIATGFGMHLAQPLLRKALDDLGPDGEKSLSEDDARKILENAMRVLFYRDARSLNKVRVLGCFVPAFSALSRFSGLGLVIGGEQSSD
jgi:20S proteasome alpha/beta subunit